MTRFRLTVASDISVDPEYSVQFLRSNDIFKKESVALTLVLTCNTIFSADDYLYKWAFGDQYVSDGTYILPLVKI